MTAYHKDLTGFDLHVPLGFSPDPLVCLTNVTDAMDWQLADNTSWLLLDTTTGAHVLTLGTTADKIGRNRWRIPNNAANSWHLSSTGRDWFHFNTTTGAEVISIDTPTTGVVSFVGPKEVRFAQPLRLAEQAGDPSPAVANTGFLYTKDDGSGNTELYYMDEGGTVAKLTPPGGGANSLQAAYNGGNTIDLAATSVDITHQAVAAPTHYAINVNYPAQAYTGVAAPHGIAVDWTTATSLTSSADVFGVRLVGETNAGAGDTVAISIDGAWDQGVENASSYIQTGGAFTFSGGNIDLDPTGTFNLAMDASQTVTLNIANTLANSFLLQDASGNDYIQANTSTGTLFLASGTANQVTEHQGTGDFRLTGGSAIRITERAADPTAVGNTGFLYTKDVSTVTQLFYRASDGTVTQVTPGGGGGGGLPHTVSTHAETIVLSEATTGEYLTANDTAGFERIILMANDVRRHVDIGDSGSVANVDPRLTFYGADGAASKNAYLELDGSVPAFQGYIQSNLFLYIDDGKTSVGYGAQTGASSTAFGDNANASGSSVVVIGRNATSVHTSTVAIGHGATTNGSSCVMVGTQGDAQSNSVAVGWDASAYTHSVVIGKGAASNGTNTATLILGSGAQGTASNQAVFGSGGQALNDFYLGQGVTHTSAPNGVTLHATSGSGTNIAGSSITIAAGTSSGTGANGGSVTLQYADTNTLLTGLRVIGGLNKTTSFPVGTVQLHQGVGSNVWRIPISTTTSTSAYSTVHTIAVASDRHYSVIVRLNMTRTAAGDEGFAAFDLFGAVSNDSGTTDENGGTAIVGDGDNLPSSQRRGIARAVTDAWKCRIIADDTADTIDIDVSGSDGKAANVKGYIEVVEG